MKTITRLLLAGALAATACSPKAEKATEPKAADTAAAQETSGGSSHAEIESPGAWREVASAYRHDTVDILVDPKGAAGGGDKLEYKIKLKGGDTVTYTWKTADGASIWSEFHGHDADKVTFYRKADGASETGVLTAPFDGEHGWYFENRTDKPIVVSLRLGGFYGLVPKA